MDPASIVLGVVGGAAALAALAVKTIKFLVELQDTHKDAALILWDLRVACHALEGAWNGIRAWIAGQNGKAGQAGSIFEQLLNHLEYCRIAMENLQVDLNKWNLKTRPKWRLGQLKKARVVVHESTLRSHCDRLNHLIGSVSLLLATAKL